MRGLRWRVAVSMGALVGLYRLVIRPWQMRWGATDDEIAMDLPGDELVAGPADQLTRAISINAPPEEVWRWIVQLGADRGGFYSYDWLENLCGLGIHSADAVVAEWQKRSVGDLVAANSARTGGWYVADLRPNDVLVLQMADVRNGRPADRTQPPGWEFVWTFALRPDGNGATRLLVRERVGFASPYVKAVFAPMGIVSFVMTHKMMLGIKARVESGERHTGLIASPTSLWCSVVCGRGRR